MDILGFSKEQLQDIEKLDYDQEIRDIIECKSRLRGKVSETKIPVIVAGGIFDRKDIEHVMKLGCRWSADCKQICRYRRVRCLRCLQTGLYSGRKRKNIQIIQSPVGMPGRASAK